MIIGHFHKGSGIGNQLFRYVFARVKAKDLGTDFGMTGEFKGAHFMNLAYAPVAQAQCEILRNVIPSFEEERINNAQGVDIRPYDEKTLEIGSDCIVDGEFQDERYFMHRLDEVREWLKVEPLDMPDDLCVINFRGGEYVGVKDLFLPQSYWNEAIQKMKEVNKNMRFEVHTDDVETARMFFPDCKIIANMEINWRSIRYAKYLILSNSSFAILPALLNENAELILAPMYWAGYNVGYWKLPQNQYKKFNYI